MMHASSNNSFYLNTSLFRRLIIFFSLFLSLSTSVFAESEMNTQDFKVTEQFIQQIVSQVKTMYVLENVGNKMAQYVAKQYQSGEYSHLASQDLAEKITADLQHISNDLHMYLRFDPDSAKNMSTRAERREGPSEERMDFFRQRAENSNYGLTEFKWLAEKVALITVTGWHELQWNKDKVDSLLTLAEGAKAIIFDVRSNGGGSPSAIRYIQGHFVDKPIHLMTFKNRMQNQSFDGYTEENVDGEKRVGIPVYILIDANCGSACEDFAMTSRDAGIATLVGETTAGAGYMNNIVPIADKFTLSVSVAGAFSAITGKNWQGIGVKPDIEIRSIDALNEAHRLALVSISKNETKESSKKRIDGQLTWIAEDLANADQSNPQLNEFVGKYQNYRIEADGQYLKVAREHRVWYYHLKRGDQFIESTRRQARLQFKREKGVVVAAEIGVPGRPPRVLTKS